MYTYESFLDVFADSGYSPSEAHAMMAAYICTDQSLDSFMQVLLEDEETVILKEKVMPLFRSVKYALADPNYSFTLLLRRENEPFMTNAYALAEWCRAFMNGIILVNLLPNTELSDDVMESLQTFEAIAEMDPAQQILTEEEKKDFFELEEYVRIAVLLLYTEIKRKDLQDEVMH